MGIIIGAADFYNLRDNSLMMKTFKIQAIVPLDLYLEFSHKAREKLLRKSGKSRGAITEAIIESMKLYLEEDKK